MNQNILDWKNARWLFEPAADAMFIINSQGDIVVANTKGETLFGYAPKELQGQLIEVLLPERFRAIHSTYRLNYASHPTTRAMGSGAALLGIHKNGTEFPIDASLTPLPVATGILVLVIVHDISELKQTEKLLQESEERLMVALQCADEGAWDWDIASGRIVSDSRWSAMFGYDVDIDTDKPKTFDAWQALIHPDDQASALQAKNDLLAGKSPLYRSEYRIKSRVGAWIWIVVHGKIVQHDACDKPLRVVGVTRDISEHKLSEEKILQLAHFDHLTGLPNRRLFYERLKQSIAQTKRNQQKLALLFLDLDGFKQINDHFGHVIGDGLLQAVAKRLRLNIRDADTVARVGGDEFIIMLNNIISSEDPAIVANKIIRNLAEVFLIQGESCTIGVSIGISIYPDSSEVMETLVIQADNAMYKVKEKGKNNYQFFTRDTL